MIDKCPNPCGLIQKVEDAEDDMTKSAPDSFIQVSRNTEKMMVQHSHYLDQTKQI